MRNEYQYQMKNEKRKVKKVKNSIVLTLLIFTFSFFFCLSCDNSIDPPVIQTPVESGYGRISVDLIEGEAAAQTARTVFPSTVFDRYVYTFTKLSPATTTGGQNSTVKTPGNDGFFTLEVGSYTVEVQAFVGDDEPYTLAATGVSPQFSVGPGSNDPVAVRLSGAAAGGQGEFSYTITYPAGAAAEITLRQWPDLDEITLIPADLTAGNGITETRELETGFYLLTVLVNKDDLYAGISEMVHIYPSLSSEYVKDFVDGDLLAVIPPLVNNYNVSGTGTFTYDGSAKTVNITRKENASTGTIIVFYNGTADVPVNVGTYTVTFNVEAVRGWSEANGLPAGTITINKAAGAVVSAPTLGIPTSNSITINPVPAPENGQTVEYARNTINSAPSTGWQDSTTFSGLSAGTTYYIFARSKENANYNAGAASTGLQVATAFPLSADTWADSSITSTASGVWYSFNVVSGTTYYVWWNDSKQGNATKSLDVTVSAVYSDGTSIFTGIDSGWTTPQQFTATTDGTVHLWMVPYSSGSTGTFAVAYNAGSTIPHYTVTFSANGGSGTVPADQTVSPGSSITLPSGNGLTRSGYTFGGWNTNTSGTGTNYSAGSSYTPPGNITLYAKWNYVVTFSANDGSGTVPATQTVAAGSSITLPSRGNLSRAGYAFGGWNTNSSGTGTSYNAGATYTLAGNITLYAKWDTFPMKGSWRFSDNDKWTGTIFRIEETNGNNFSGYFDWYEGSTYWGREHIRGTYYPATRKLEFAGYALSNTRTIYVNGVPQTLALDDYEAYLATNGYDFATGNSPKYGWVWEAKLQY